MMKKTVKTFLHLSVFSALVEVKERQWGLLLPPESGFVLPKQKNLYNKKNSQIISGNHQQPEENFAFS